MSTLNVQRFFQQARLDPELDRKIREACSQSSEALPARLAALAAERNLLLSEEDLLTSAQPASQELSDDELETVSGGYVTPADFYRQYGIPLPGW
jgi:predicted ribosomally synthesized peptide with nif11-like leader